MALELSYNVVDPKVKSKGILKPSSNVVFDRGPLVRKKVSKIGKGVDSFKSRINQKLKKAWLMLKLRGLEGPLEELRNVWKVETLTIHCFESLSHDTGEELSREEG